MNTLFSFLITGSSFGFWYYCFISPKRFLRRTKIKAGICCCLTFLGVGITFPIHFFLNMSTSMPIGIYAKDFGEIARGDTVTACLGGAAEQEYLQFGMCPSGVQPIVKYVAAIEGDKVLVSEESILITPKEEGPSCVWPPAKSQDSMGFPLKSHLQSGIIPIGQVLLMTPHEGSYDGRYFGTISITRL